jgi:sugar lactone lactonase YvrE
MAVKAHCALKLAVILCALTLMASGLTWAGQASEVFWGQQLGTADEDFANAIAVDASGECWIAGATKSTLGDASAGGSDIVVARFDAAGEKIWVRQFGSAADDRGFAIAVDSEMNAYLAGVIGRKLAHSQVGALDVFVCKLDPKGQVLWARQFGSSPAGQPVAMARDASGNIYVAGTTAGKMGAKQFGAKDCFLARLDPTGQVTWIAQWGTPADDGAIGVAVDKDGNLLVAGATAGRPDAANGDLDMLLSKLSSKGEVLWSRQYGGAEKDSARRVAISQDGSIYLGGWTGNDLGGKQQGQGDAVLLKLTPAGAVVWQRQFGTELWDGIHGIAFSPDGKVVLVGGCQHWPQCQAFERSFDLDGNELWKNEISASYPVCGTQIAVDAEGNLYQTGGVHGPLYGAYSGSENATNDIFLVKVAPGASTPAR